MELRERAPEVEGTLENRVSPLSITHRVEDVAPLSS